MEVVPEGAWAANLLGLSTQVPAKIIYLTDGPNNEVPIGRRSIHFKHARPKAMAGLEGKFALVVQALRHLARRASGRPRSRSCGPRCPRRRSATRERYALRRGLDLRSGEKDRGEGGVNGIARMPTRQARGGVR